MNAQPYTIDVPQAVLDDLQKRLKRTRWADAVEGDGWDYGTNLDYLKELVAYWQNGFDWRRQEAALNQFAHYRAEIDGVGVHFIHEKGKGPNPTPILLLHGWPDSFYRFYKIIPMLTDPASYGGDASQSFDVIVPSLTGFGFTDRPTQRGSGMAYMDNLLFKLMTDVLGYRQFGVHGGDTGSPQAQYMAIHHPEAVTGVHLMDIGYHATTGVDPSRLTKEEQDYFQMLEQAGYSGGAYAIVHGFKPQSLAYGLNDSPAGLAAWIIEKYQAWSDLGESGDLESAYTKDELLTNLTIYWVTQTINSSIRNYYEGFHQSEISYDDYVKTPVGVIVFPANLPPPRVLAERTLNVKRFTEAPRGGHFAALETPEILVDDIRAFFGELR